MKSYKEVYPLSSITIDVTKYEWQNKPCYVGNMKYSVIPHLIDLKSDLSMNRDINDSRVDDIVTYLTEQIEGTFFPPVILSSNATMEYSDSTCKLNIQDGNFTVIDGQHRISAISRLIEDPSLNKKYKNIRLPVLIIEGLENYQHRNLFNTINKKAKIVDSNIAIRFTPNLENLLGLRYFSKNMEHKELIEWEKKQSFAKDKVAYIHLTDCIKGLNKQLIKCEALQTYLTTNDERLLYTKDEYYNIIQLFLNSVLNFINQNQENRKKLEFYTTKAYLRAIADELCEKIIQTEDLDTYSKIKDLFQHTLNDLLNNIVIPYSGKLTSSSVSYKSIRTFLKVNKLLVPHETNIEPLKPLIIAYLNCFYTIGEMFELTEDDFKNVDDFIRGAFEHTTSLIDFNTEDFTLNKQTSIETLLEHLNPEEEHVPELPEEEEQGIEQL